MRCPGRLKVVIKSKNSLHNFEKLAKNPIFGGFFGILIKIAHWKLLKIVSHVDFIVPVHLARSDLAYYFNEGDSKFSCAVGTSYVSVRKMFLTADEHFLLGGLPIPHRLSPSIHEQQRPPRSHFWL